MTKTDIEPIANEFEMSVDRFLRVYKLNRLPGQLPDRNFSEDQDQDGGVDLGLELAGMRKSPAWKRIKRAADSSGQTVKEFVTESIMDHVRCEEETMILSPRTGKPICDRWALDESLD
jgi:hypothetical protein